MCAAHRYLQQHERRCPSSGPIGMGDPRFPAQQLHREPITRFTRSTSTGISIKQLAFTIDVNIPIPAPGLANLENPFFSCKHPAEKVTPIRPFGKFSLKIACTTGRPSSDVRSFSAWPAEPVFECYHGGHRFPQAERQLALILPKASGVQADRNFQKFIAAPSSGRPLCKIVVAHRHTPDSTRIRRQTLRICPSTQQRIPRNPEQYRNATCLLHRSLNPIAV